MNVKEAKNFAREVLSSNTSKTRSPSVNLDVSVLLCDALKCNKTFLLTHESDELSKEQEEKFCTYIQKRNSGLPVAYITHRKEFYGLDFYVDENVLIPKPDTEILVEKAVELCESLSHDRLNVADVCTGSGCIAVSVAKNTDAHFFASDISKKALEIAEQNANGILGTDNCITFYQGDLLKAFPEQLEFDIILSNPPYVPSKIVDELLEDGRNEPRLALDGNIKNDDGMELIRPLIEQSFKKLKTDGYFLFETGEYNAVSSAEYCKKCGFSVISILKDLEGTDRVVFAQKK